jgi:hypothetical protein
MERFIARENIRRFERQLESCTDETQRATLEKLLADEQARLAIMTIQTKPRPA